MHSIAMVLSSILFLSVFLTIIRASYYMDDTNRTIQYTPTWRHRNSTTIANLTVPGFNSTAVTLDYARLYNETLWVILYFLYALMKADLYPARVCLQFCEKTISCTDSSKDAICNSTLQCQMQIPFTGKFSAIQVFDYPL